MQGKTCWSLVRRDKDALLTDQITFKLKQKSILDVLPHFPFDYLILKPIKGRQSSAKFPRENLHYPNYVKLSRELTRRDLNFPNKSFNISEGQQVDLSQMAWYVNKMPHLGENRIRKWAKLCVVAQGTDWRCSRRCQCETFHRDLLIL